MKKISIFAGVLFSFGLTYFIYTQDYNLKIAKFRNELWESENRIMRDEMNKMARARTYEQGVMDTVIRAKLDSGFQDGLYAAYGALNKESQDSVDAYHRAIEHSWAGTHYNEQLNKKKLEEVKKEAYDKGLKDAVSLKPE